MWMHSSGCVILLYVQEVLTPFIRTFLYKLGQDFLDKQYYSNPNYFLVRGQPNRNSAVTGAAQARVRAGL